jgi:UDP-N-acetylglucosamine 2-epimerase (non-hydrolysing)
VRITGNPVVDALLWIRHQATPSAALQQLLDALSGKRVLALTTHRRENLGPVMQGHLLAIRDFTRAHEDVAVVFPVHPNPEVQRAAREVLADEARVHLIEPLPYGDFIHLLSSAWLLCSDSGGVQEEAPTLRKPVLILRDSTERQEVLDCGVGRLAGRCPVRLRELLEQAYGCEDWHQQVQQVHNPFGCGDAGPRILAALDERYGAAAGTRMAAADAAEAAALPA